MEQPSSGPLDELWDLVVRIPRGKVISYGVLGACLSSPVSGYQVGRAMARCKAPVPWWRVVAKTGMLPIGKRDPRLGMEQRERLAEEGVTFEDGLIVRSCFLDEIP